MEALKCCLFLYIHLKSFGHELDNSRPNNVFQYGHFKGVNKLLVLEMSVVIYNMTSIFRMRVRIHLALSDVFNW